MLEIRAGHRMTNLSSQHKYVHCSLTTDTSMLIRPPQTHVSVLLLLAIYMFARSFSSSCVRLCIYAILALSMTGDADGAGRGGEDTYLSLLSISARYMRTASSRDWLRRACFGRATNQTLFAMYVYKHVRSANAKWRNMYIYKASYLYERMYTHIHDMQ